MPRKHNEKKSDKELASPEVTKALELLRNKGFAVVVFTTEELGTARPFKVVDRLVELGWEVIDDLQGY